MHIRPNLIALIALGLNLGFVLGDRYKENTRKQIVAFSSMSHHMLSSVWHLPTLNEEETDQFEDLITQVKHSTKQGFGFFWPRKTARSALTHTHIITQMIH